MKGDIFANMCDKAIFQDSVNYITREILVILLFCILRQSFQNYSLQVLRQLWILVVSFYLVPYRKFRVQTVVSTKYPMSKITIPIFHSNLPLHYALAKKPPDFHIVPTCFDAFIPPCPLATHKYLEHKSYVPQCIF